MQDPDSIDWSTTLLILGFLVAAREIRGYDGRAPVPPGAPVPSGHGGLSHAVPPGTRQPASRSRVPLHGRDLPGGREVRAPT